METGYMTATYTFALLTEITLAHTGESIYDDHVILANAGIQSYEEQN